MWAVLFILAFVAVSAVDSSKVVCYYTNWSQYRNSKGKFVPENVDPAICTHIMYAFAKPVGNSIKAYEWNDESTQWSKGMYERMMNMKAQNPNLKVLLAVGGFNVGSGPFTVIAKSSNDRKAFAQSALSFLRQHNFDGLDVDWEYPSKRGSPPQDKQNFLYLMQELMQTFQSESRVSGKPRLLLTGAFPAGKPNIDDGFDLPALSSTMDFINLMTYDLHGSWEKQTGMNSPLFAHQQDTGDLAHLNLDWVARYYVSKGVPKDKLIIGLATYGRSFTLDDASVSGLNAPASQPGQAGRYTNEKGFMAYYEICEMLQSGARSFDVPSQRSRYLVQGRQWVGYDDVQSITEKACYVKENGFGGIMFWALDLDDFTGQTCGQGRYPLMNAALREINQPSLANCVRRTTGGQNPAQPNPANPGIVTYRPTPFPSIYATQRPTYQPAATSQPVAQTGQRPAGYVPINPPKGVPSNPATSAPFTFAPVTNAPITYAPITFAPVTSAPYQPSNPVTPAPSTQNPYSFTLPTYGVNTPKPPSGVTFLPGNPTGAPITFAPPVTNAPVTFAPKTTPGPSLISNFDCTNKISDFYADPASCDHFYICANKVKYRVPCALGLKYNTAAKHCDWSSNVNCQGRPSLPASGGFPSSNPSRPTPAPTLAPTPAPTQRPVTATNACANQQTGFQRHPTDCSKFYQCNFGMAYLMTCPGVLVFNSAKNSCDYRGNVPGCP